MKITIYELLGLIKDNKAPKKIKYEYRIFEFKNLKEGHGYVYEPDQLVKIWLANEIDIDDARCLNDEVEIIEEEKIKNLMITYSPDIEEKIVYEDGDKPNHCIIGDAATELLAKKMIEIVDKLNNMENKNEM